MQPTKNFNIVFDINNVLCDSTTHAGEELLFFQRKGLVVTAIKTHYIFPGVIELMQLLCKMPDVKISFFSEGSQTKNELLVEQLLTHALGKEAYEERKNKIRIFSGLKDDYSTDLTQNSDWESRKQWISYSLHHGNWKKSLANVISKEDSLENSILIDNDYTFIKHGQESNYLHVPSIYLSHYEETKNDDGHSFYNEDGLKKIPIHNCSSVMNFEFLRLSVVRGDCIGLLIEKDVCVVCFFNNETKHYDKLELSEKNHPALYSEILDYYHKEKFLVEEDEIELAKKTKRKLHQKLYTLLESHQAKTSAINLKINRICYIAGMIFKALEHARSGSTIAKFLFPLHFREAEISNTYEPLFNTENATHLNEAYTLYGCERLRQVNGSFKLITHQDYIESCRVFNAQNPDYVNGIEESCHIM